MKKSVALLCVCALLLVALSSCGAVERVEMESHDAAKGDESNSRDSSFEDTFLKVREIEGDGRYHEFVYDLEQHLLADEYHYADGSLFYVYATYTYDENGNLVSSDVFNDGLITYSYDSLGNMQEKTEYYKDGTISKVTEYIMGQPIRSTQYRDGGAVWWWTEYSYDSGGNLIEQARYDKDGKEEERITHSYDSNGNETVVETYERGKGSSRTEYTYDAEGNITSETEFSVKGEIKQRIEYVYDGGQEPLEVVVYDSDWEIIRRADSEKDERGNVIAVTMYGHAGNVLQREERTYDAEGRVLTVNYTNDRNIDENGHYNPARQTSFEYDEYGNVTMKADFFGRTEYEYVRARDYQAYLDRTAVSGLTKLDWVQVRNALDFWCENTDFSLFVTDLYGEVDYGDALNTEYGYAFPIKSNPPIDEIRSAYQEYTKPYFSQNIIQEKLDEMNRSFVVRGGQTYVIGGFGGYVGCISNEAKLESAEGNRYIISVPMDTLSEDMISLDRYSLYYFIRENGKMVYDG